VIVLLQSSGSRKQSTEMEAEVSCQAQAGIRGGRSP
jgi:hypothetical protein